MGSAVAALRKCVLHFLPVTSKRRHCFCIISKGAVAKRKFCSSSLFVLWCSVLLNITDRRTVLCLLKAWQSRPGGFSRSACGIFLVLYLLCSFFLRIMGFQPSFLLLHPVLCNRRSPTAAGAVVNGRSAVLQRPGKTCSILF